MMFIYFTGASAGQRTFSHYLRSHGRMLKDDKASIVGQRDQRKYLEDTAIKALYHTVN